MILPYDYRDSFEYNITYYQGTIYIEEDHKYKLQTRSQDRQGNSQQDVQSFWGYKFETLSTLPVSWAEASRDFIENRPFAQVSNYEQFCAVAQTGFEGLKVTIGGEVDAIWDEHPVNPALTPPNYVELKTTKTPDWRNRHHREVWEKKLLKWWAQSYLLAVPRIIVGFRNKPWTENQKLQSKLIDLFELKTLEIPATVAKNDRTWSPVVCVNFLHDCLALLKDHVSGPGVWKLHGHEGRIVLRKVAEEGTGEILSEEFLNWREGRA